MKKAYFTELYGTILKMRTQAELRALLHDLLTPQELISLAERLQIFKRFARGVPHRNISKDLKVSIAKITRGSHAFKKSRIIASLLARKK